MKAPIFAQVDKAVTEMMNLILTKPDDYFFLLVAAMQSGKTQFIEDMYIMLRKYFPNCMGLYVSSHNHKDFIIQNFSRLDHLQAKDLYCLTLRERRNSQIKRRPLKSYNNDPVFTFYDENHHGDGLRQTIDRWLEDNQLYPQRKVYLIGVSATPFSSLLRAKDTTVMYDSSLMPNYKSVTQMLKRGDLEEATPITKTINQKVTVLESSSAYQYLENLILNKDYGYAILRLPNADHANHFEKHLLRKFGQRVHVRQWNQKNQLDNPAEYFGTFRKNVVTVVIVQQKARMGNTFPTRFAHMVYEYSPLASVATVSQGLLGRMCGHGKIDDHVKVFTHLKHAAAYSLFENAQFEDFYSYLAANNLKPSQRSNVVVTTEQKNITEIISSNTLDRSTVIENVQKHLTEKFGELPVFNDVTFRVLSRNAFEGYWYKEIFDGPMDDAASKKLVREPEKVSVIVDDRKLPHDVYASFRQGEYIPVATLAPKPTSIYSKI